jgi:anti-sigma factor ChrR (cupin superfamily)
MNAVSIDVNKVDWRPALQYPGDAEEKVLSAGGSMTPRTILLKIPAGWSMDRHSHRYTELHYVLEGSYESDGEVFPTGTFRMIPKEVEHGPFATKRGATILVVWCTLGD